MSNKVEYLEKYSVAPSPNRDYYGIKVTCDEIILFLWKISHGPHRTPAIQVSKFSEFGSDKILQEEIQRNFGNYVLEHVKNISGRKLSLLTLPRRLIAKITKYLNVKDILNLSTLSRIAKEVFDNDVVWKAMYTKLKGSKISKEDKKIIMASSWKQLLKEEKLQGSVKNEMSNANESKVGQPINSIKQIKKNPRPVKKSSQDTAANFENKIASQKQKHSDSEKTQTHGKRFPSSTASESRKKTVLPNQVQIISRGKELNPSRPQTKTNKNAVLDLKKNLTKPKSDSGIKSTQMVKSVKNSSNILNRKFKSNQTVCDIKNKTLNPSSKHQKDDVKQKISSESKLMSLDIDKSLLKYNHNSDISPIIGENLKKIKSPRSIFNYDFSVLEDKKSFGDSRHLSPKSKNENLINFEKMDNISNSSANIEIPSDEQMDRSTQNHYLNASANFTKSVDRVLKLPLSQNLRKDSLLNEKYRKSLRTVPENLGKFGGTSLTVNNEEEDNIIKELSKIRFANDKLAF